jgi:heme iron utilization protein
LSIAEPLFVESRSTVAFGSRRCRTGGAGRGTARAAMSADRAPDPAPADAAAQARRLLRVARTAALATLDRATGAPLATLVSVASDYDGAPLLLLSTLARHTGNLAADARASLLLTSPPGRGDPLNRSRLTISGPLAPHPAPGARARFVARNPKSKLYASFADFSILRMEVTAVHFNGGFARAAALTPADVLTDLAGAEALIVAEAALVDEINGGARAFLAKLAGDDAAYRKRAWRAIGLDPEGLDLAAGARAARASFPAPAATPQAWRQALGALAARLER